MIGLMTRICNGSDESQIKQRGLTLVLKKWLFETQLTHFHCSVAMGIDHEYGFNWWVPHMLKKCDVIITLVKTSSARYLKHKYKCEMEWLKTLENALELEKQNSMWADAIAKAMKNVGVAFNIIEDGSQPPIRNQFIKCHMIFDLKWKIAIFDIKMKDSNWKRRLVARG